MQWYFFDIEGLARQLDEEAGNEMLEFVSGEMENPTFQETTNLAFNDIIECIIESGVLEIINGV